MAARPGVRMKAKRGRQRAVGSQPLLPAVPSTHDNKLVTALRISVAQHVGGPAKGHNQFAHAQRSERTATLGQMNERLHGGINGRSGPTSGIGILIDKKLM